MSPEVVALGTGALAALNTLLTAGLWFKLGLVTGHHQTHSQSITSQVQELSARVGALEAHLRQHREASR